jgi:hypothetical protein
MTGHIAYVYDEDFGAIAALFDAQGNIVSTGCDPAPER